MVKERCRCGVGAVRCIPGARAAAVAGAAARATGRGARAAARRAAVLHQPDAASIQLSAVQLLYRSAHVRVRRELHHAVIQKKLRQ